MYIIYKKELPVLLYKELLQIIKEKTTFHYCKMGKTYEQKIYKCPINVLKNVHPQ